MLGKSNQFLDENFIKKFDSSKFIKEGSGLNVHFTGGTTGEPKAICFSQDDISEIIKYLKWFCKVEGINGGERVLILMDQFFWGVGYITALGHAKAGNSVIPVDSDISKFILKQIVERAKPTVVSSLPSVLFEYREVLKSENLKFLETTGEYLSKKDRESLQNYFNAEVFDAYGLTEGLIGVECSQHDGYHYNPRKVKLEVIDLDNEKFLGENEWGELVLTNLIRSSLPKIERYKTGDICKILFKKCNCGINYPRVWIKGRKNKAYSLYEGYELSEIEIINVFKEVLGFIPNNFLITCKKNENRYLLSINLDIKNNELLNKVYCRLMNLNYEIKAMIKMNKLKIVINANSKK